MTNLLVETLKVMNRHGKRVEDIVFIGSADGTYACKWTDFERLAEPGEVPVAVERFKIARDGLNIALGLAQNAEWDGAA